jgi:hypothetical protein
MIIKNLKLILEKTAAAKRDIILPSIVDFIEKYRKMYGDGDERYFFHFSNFNKLGIYPSSDEETGPIGIYCYQL